MSNKTIWDLAMQNANSMEKTNSNNNIGKDIWPFSMPLLLGFCSEIPFKSLIILLMMHQNR